MVGCVGVHVGVGVRVIARTLSDCPKGTESKRDKRLSSHSAHMANEQGTWSRGCSCEIIQPRIPLVGHALKGGRNDDWLSSGSGSVKVKSKVDKSLALPSNLLTKEVFDQLFGGPQGLGSCG